MRTPHKHLESTMPLSMLRENRLRRQQRHHPGGPGSGRGDGAFLREYYFNPSSMYEPARRGGRGHWPRPARQIARHFGLDDPKQILFTGCATESNNTAIFGAAKANPNAATSSPPPWSTRPCWKCARTRSATATR